MLKKIFALAIATCALNSHAEVLSYSGVRAGYVVSDVDVLGDFSGVGLRGSYSINDLLFVTGAYTKQTSDDEFFGSEIDVTSVGVGVGLRKLIDDRTHIVGQISRIDGEVEFAGLEEDANATNVNIEVRHAFSAKLEANASLVYQDGEEDNDQFGVVGLNYFVQDNISIGVETTVGQDDVDSYALILSLTP